MHILIIQEKGRHIQNAQYRECLNFQRAFSRQFSNVKITIYGLNWDTFCIPFHEIIKDVDVIFILENYDSGWMPNLSNVNKLKIFWSIDSHCALQSHLAFCAKHKFNIVLNAIDQDRHFFEEHNMKTYYFPNAYPLDLIQPLNIEKSIDVGFVGSLGNRGDWIRSLNINPHVMVLGDDMVKSINSFKIHFNRNLSHDINYRTFETLGCATLLLTNNTDRLSDLFEIGKHLVVYESLEDCQNKISYYLAHEQERNEISNNGYLHVKEHHTFDNRCKMLVNIINSNS